MAYNLDDLTRMKALKQLAERIIDNYTSLELYQELADKVNSLTVTGGEPNIIEKIYVNGEKLDVEDKGVEISVPTKVSELENDSAYQTEEEVLAALATALADEHFSTFEVVDEIPTPEEAQDNILYLVMNEKTGYYDIYAKIGEEVVLLDDTSVDLENYVQKEEGKGLSTNDFTDEEKEKLDGMEIATDEEVEEMLDELFGEN